MIKHCLHIIKGGSCKDGIVTVFELFINNSQISEHIVVSILPIRYQCNIGTEIETYTLLSWRFYKLFSLICKLRILALPNNLVIKTWGHAAAYISKFFRLFLSAPIVWGIHDSGPGSQRLVNLLVRLNRKHSYNLPDSIVCVSHATLDQYKDHFGYDHRKLVYIANGLDSNRFHPYSDNHEIRKSFQIPEFSPVIGIVSRYCLEKGVDIFIEAMHEVLKELPNARFIFCGYKMDQHNPKLIKKLHKFKIFEHSILLGQRSDMPHIYNILDILVLPSSFKEAQSCCLMEAMSCGITCVSTNIGDSKIILGNTGRLLQNNDPRAISEECIALINKDKQERDRLRKESREWVVKTFDLKTFINRYESVLKG